MSGKTSDFTTKYSPSIILDPRKKYEAALLSIDLYNSIPNITDKNNIFEYSTNTGVTWKTITLDPGSYELSAINDEIQRQMIANGDYDKINNLPYISITANISTLKSVIQISNPEYSVHFGNYSLASVLGFEGGEHYVGYPGGIRFESPNIVDIIKINSILVNVDIIMGSYVNGLNTSTIYAFYPNVPPGYKIVERPSPSLIYYPVSRTEISSIRCWLTDQNGDSIDLRGERITLRISIKEIKNIKDQVVSAVKELKNENIF
jgi:hypothetical protein